MSLRVPSKSPAITVLVVDDSPEDVAVVRRCLERGPRSPTSDGRTYVVHDRALGADAVAFVRDPATRPDVVLLDHQLSDMSGIEVLDALASTPDLGRTEDEHGTQLPVPVILLTGSGLRPDLAVAAMRAGAIDYLVKDAIASDLLRLAVDRAVARSASARLVVAQRDALASANRRLAAQSAAMADQASALEARTREAEAANRAKGQFLSTMSHELRTPLNAIGGYTQLLELGLRGPVTPEQASDLGRIQANQQRLLSLIDDILTFTRVEAGRLPLHIVDVPLGDALALVHAAVEPQLKRNRLTYVVDAGHASIVVLADRDRLQQIVINLLSNAAKFTPAGGRVTLRYGARQQADGTPVAWAAVQDSGPGIAADQQGAVFEPFVQTSEGLARKAEGSGLGLAISRELARAMGGDLTLDSQLGAGATFTLTLPLGAGVPVEALVERRTRPRWASPRGGLLVPTDPEDGDAVPGLTVDDVTDAVTLGAQALARRYAARLRTDADLPYAQRASDAELEDYAATYLVQVAKAVRTVARAAATDYSADPGAEDGMPVLDMAVDDADILRLVSERHGAQRHALGWPADAIARDSAHLAGVVADALAPGAAGPDAAGARARALFLGILAMGAAAAADGFAAADRAASTARGGPDAPPRVLLAEDDELERFVYANLLRHAGYVVEEAADGDSAVRLAALAPPDVAVLDIQMPGRDGWAVAAALRAEDATRGIPLVALTGSSGPDGPGSEGRRRAEALGFADFLAKPLRPQAVLAAVARLVRAGARSEPFEPEPTDAEPVDAEPVDARADGERAPQLADAG